MTRHGQRHQRPAGDAARRWPSSASGYVGLPDGGHAGPLRPPGGPAPSATPRPAGHAASAARSPSSRRPRRAGGRRAWPPATCASPARRVEAVEGAEFVFLCVPTPQGDDGSADLSYVEAVAERSARTWRRAPSSSTSRPSRWARPWWSSGCSAAPTSRSCPTPSSCARGPPSPTACTPSASWSAPTTRRRRPGRRAVRRDPGAAAHHRRRHGGDDQVRLQRLPGHQAELRQRGGRPVRGGGRRRPRRHPRASATTSASASSSCSPGPGWGGSLPAQGHPGPASTSPSRPATTSRS